MSPNPPRKGATLFFLATCFAATAWPQLTWKGCADLRPADFKKVTLVKGQEILKLDLDRQGKVYFTERPGRLRRYDPATGLAVELLRLPVNMGVAASYGNARPAPHNGLLGIALDPGFATNGWIFLSYNSSLRSDPQTGSIRLSRFTLAGDKVDPASEKLILEAPYDLEGEHTGGALAFGPGGNLHLSLGDNSFSGCGVTVYEHYAFCNALRSSANTHDLRGKILRIKPMAIPASRNPEPGAGSTYAIPAGNLFPPGAHPAGKTLPEIYSMGHRNPYTLHVDPLTGWVLEASPSPGNLNYPAPAGRVGRDEFNLIKGPGNYGWPMFEGANLAHNFYDFAGNKPGPMFDPAHPRNTSVFNTGLTDLPLPQSSALDYGKSTPDFNNHPVPGFTVLGGGNIPVAGPIYAYDGALRSRAKAPPHLHRKWIMADVFQQWVRAATLDANGRILRVDDIVAPGTVRNPLDIKTGPDGALYFASYHAGEISRLEYIGTCLPDSTPVALGRKIAFLGGRSWPGAEGDVAAELFDSRGRRRMGRSGSISGSITGLEPGIYHIRHRRRP